MADPITDGAAEQQSDAPVFYTGQSMADVFAPSSAPAQSDTAPTETPAESDTVSKQAVPETPFTKQAEPEEDQQEQVADEQPPEVDPLLRKYGEDPKKWADAFRAMQRRTTRNENETRQLRNQLQVMATMAAQQQDKREEQPKGTTEALNVAELSDAEVAKLASTLTEDTTQGIKALLEAARKQGEVGYSAAQKRAEAERIQREQESIVQHNNAMAFSRAKAILLERARSEGDEQMVKKLSKPNYEIDQDEWDMVYEDVNREYEYIVNNYQLKGGKITDDHFRKAQRELDPESYEERLKREAYQKALNDLQKGKGDQRLEPSSKKAPADRKTAKLEDLPQDSAQAFEWAMSNPEQARRLLQKQGVR